MAENRSDEENDAERPCVIEVLADRVPSDVKKRLRISRPLESRHWTIEARDESTLLCAVVVLRTTEHCASVLLPLEATSRAIDLLRTLIQHAVSTSRENDIGLLQCAIASNDVDARTRLQACEFTEITQYVSMVWRTTETEKDDDDSLSLHRCSSDDLAQLTHMVTLTLRESYDFPELNRWQDAADVVTKTSHHDATRQLHYLATYDGTLVGCLLMREHHTGNRMELGYVGVMSKFRRRGIGQQLVQHAQRITRERNQQELIVGVDIRNDPALAIYTRTGFVETDTQRVFFAEAVR